MTYNQPSGLLSDPVKTRVRANSEIKTKDRPKGSGRVYSKNETATASTFGTLPKNYRGMAYDRNNKKVDFSTNNNDSRRTESFRIY